MPWPPPECYPSPLFMYTVATPTGVEPIITHTVPQRRGQYSLLFCEFRVKAYWVRGASSRMAEIWRLPRSTVADLKCILGEA